MRRNEIIEELIKRYLKNLKIEHLTSNTAIISFFEKRFWDIHDEEYPLNIYKKRLINFKGQIFLITSIQKMTTDESKDKTLKSFDIKADEKKIYSYFKDKRNRYSGGYDELIRFLIQNELLPREHFKELKKYNEKIKISDGWGKFFTVLDKEFFEHYTVPFLPPIFEKTDI